MAMYSNESMYCVHPTSLDFSILINHEDNDENNINTTYPHKHIYMSIV